MWIDRAGTSPFEGPVPRTSGQLTEVSEAVRGASCARRSGGCVLGGQRALCADGSPRNVCGVHVSIPRPRRRQCSFASLSLLRDFKLLGGELVSLIPVLGTWRNAWSWWPLCVCGGNVRAQTAREGSFKMSHTSLPASDAELSGTVGMKPVAETSPLTLDVTLRLRVAHTPCC